LAKRPVPRRLALRAVDHAVWPAAFSAFVLGVAASNMKGTDVFRRPVDPRSTNSRRSIMSVAKVTEIIASSNKSFEDAIEQGVARAAKTLQNVKSAWVKSHQVEVENGKITEYRVTLKVVFVLND
jgi:flavin-binding protein dodecin